MKFLRFLLVVGMLLFMLAAPLIAQENSATASPLTSYTVPGSYAIGKALLKIPIADGKSMLAAIWYPVAAAATPNELSLPAETFVENIESFKLGSGVAYGTPDRTNAPYPLLVFSHGWSGMPAHYLLLEEHLVSWGFVVVAPYHVDRDWYPSSVQRFLDIQLTLQWLDTLTAVGGAFEGVIDMEQIAVGGHSAGAVTAFGAGGAWLSWNSVEQYCAETEAPYCYDLPKTLEEVEELIGTAPDEAGMWQTISDTRVKAIVSYAGIFDFYGQEGLAHITAPIMLIRGSADEIDPNWFNVAYDYVASTQKISLIFDGAGHYIAPATKPEWRQDDEVQVNAFITAFLLDVLKGDAVAHAALASDAVDFPGVTYIAEGF